ncbi:hypothetical protein T265_12235, partial [Opisthorchis viverrini]
AFTFSTHRTSTGCERGNENGRKTSHQCGARNPVDDTTRTPKPVDRCQPETRDQLGEKCNFTPQTHGHTRTSTQPDVHKQITFQVYRVSLVNCCPASSHV